MKTQGKLIAGAVVIVAAIVIVWAFLNRGGGNGMTAYGNPKGLHGPPGAHPAETADYINNLVDFEPRNKKDSSFEYDFDCGNCGKPKIHMWISPETKAHKVKWKDGMSGSTNVGWIVAAIYNADDSAYVPLSLKHGETAYLWVGPLNDAGTDHGIAFYKINKSDGSASGPMMATKYWQHCVYNTPESRSHAAAHHEHPNGQTCTDENAGDPAGATLMAVGGSSVGTWISCTGGCCQVQLQQQERQ